MNEARLKSYLKSGYRFVNGWLRPGAADSVVALSAEQRLLNIAGGIAEIGVHHHYCPVNEGLFACNRMKGLSLQAFSCGVDLNWV